VITNDRELQAALDWLAYWTQNRSGEQSWIGNEQARQRVSELRRQIANYRNRNGNAHSDPAPAAPQRGPEASTRTVNRVGPPESET
jgi:hypothetical protein